MKRWILAYALYLPLYGIPAAAAHSEGSNTAGAVRLDSAIQDLGASTLQDGTPLTVVLKETVRGGRVAAGSPVSFSVASDVLAPNGRDVILRAGTPAYGVVSESGGAGAFGRSGKLKITCDYVAGADGVRIPLRPASKNGSIRSIGRSSTSAATITGVLVFIPTWIALDFSINGIGIGTDGNKSPAPLPLSAAAGLLAASFWRGGNATLQEGRVFNVEVAATTPLAPSAAKVGSR